MMPSYRFLAATKGNETRDGMIEADSVQEALAALHGRGLYVIRIGKPSRFSSLWIMLNRDVALRPPVGSAELARLSQEWAGLVEAGIPVEESLALLGRTGRSDTRRVLSAIREAVKTGTVLYDALSRFPDSFPPAYRALVQAGETAGDLGPTLRRLGDNLMARRALAEEVRNALLYPLFLLITATAGVLVLLLVVVPNIESLIGEGGVERLPTATRLVLVVSHILRDYGAALAVITAALAIGFSFFFLMPAGRMRLDAFILRTPFVGALIRVIETGRFVRTLGSLLAGGVAVSAAIRISLDTIGNRHMRAGLEAAHSSIVSGASIGDAIAASCVFGEDAISLIRVGERTGRLAEALERTATLHEARATRQLKALTAMLTPLLTIGFGALAGAIVYAMLSTILGINELISP
ncbi:type II secretion system F family protein [Microvirga sp. 2TAF3]|uniref:type II secretion system F family protein n=1 Tax=Microvirga sp. 2TAF3 TaxID=3233014 RepID=UPI003F96382B